MHQQAPHQEAVRRHQHLFKHHLPDIPTSSAMSSYVNIDLAMRGCTCGCEGSGIGLDSVARLVGPWQAAVQIEVQKGAGQAGSLKNVSPPTHYIPYHRRWRRCWPIVAASPYPKVKAGAADSTSRQAAVPPAPYGRAAEAEFKEGNIHTAWRTLIT